MAVDRLFPCVCVCETITDILLEILLAVTSKTIADNTAITDNERDGCTCMCTCLIKYVWWKGRKKEQKMLSLRLNIYILHYKING